MKKLVYIFFVFLTLSVVMSCGRSVDNRLVLADTLMWTNPDSSLAILNAINRDSLQGDENQAYYALLLTQAQFRCNGNCSSDTLINFAVDYYSDNHNREHYTRSLLYKGSFYEVHDNPIEAIKWYKQAEDNADSTDYRNLAQINIRLGMLYYNYYASNNLDAEKLMKSYSYYRKLGDKRMMVFALMNAANVYRVSNPGQAIKNYKLVQDLAIELNDTSSLYLVLFNQGLMCMLDSSYLDAKAYLKQAFALAPNGVANSDYFTMSETFAHLGVVDSAEFYFNKADLKSCNSYDSVMLFRARKEISLAKGDYANSVKYEKLYLNLSESLEHNKEKYALRKFESNFDENRIASKNEKVTSLNKTIYYLIALFLVFAAIAILFIINNKKRKDQQRLVEELRNEDFGKYEELRNNLLDIDNHFSKTMSEKLKSLEDMMAGAYNPQQNPKSNEVTHKLEPIEDEDSKFWEGLYSYINIKHNGAMDKIANDYPQLSTADLNFIKLMCCGFSDAAIAVCRNYRNVASVRSRKNKIKEKMGIEETLSKYIKSIME